MGALWSPGYFRADLRAGQRRDAGRLDRAVGDDRRADAGGRRWRRSASAAGGCSRWPVRPRGSRSAAELVLAADQFIITPAGRVEDAARAQRRGRRSPHRHRRLPLVHRLGPRHDDQPRRADARRRGRYREAGYILRTFAHYVRDGLIPNMFPDGEREGLYHTADATLWFFHALDRYLDATGDRDTLRQLLPMLRRHRRASPARARASASASIRRTACCAQGAGGLSAHLDGREGRRLGGDAAARQGGRDQRALVQRAAPAAKAGCATSGGDAGGLDLARARRPRAASRSTSASGTPTAATSTTSSTAKRGDDPACRPNQLFAISLTIRCSIASAGSRCCEVVRERLLTPVGLRSLAPGHPDYKPQYYGDLRARDAAYHQGTVWALADRAVHRRLAEGASGATATARGSCSTASTQHLDEACIGSISEIFDAEAPFTPRGCVAQAWSVAEVLRCSRRRAPAAERVRPWMPRCTREACDRDRPAEVGSRGRSTAAT